MDAVMDARAFNKSRFSGRRATGGYLREDRATVTGKTIEPNLANVKLNTNQKVVCPVSIPTSATGGAMGLQGSLALGQPNALPRDGEMIAIDAERGTLDVELSTAEMEKRRKAWKAPPNPCQSGVLRKYADQGGPTYKGTVTHAGGKAEVVCYADI